MSNEHLDKASNDVDSKVLDDYDTDFKLPEMDWDKLEMKLKETQLEITNQRSMYQMNERDEIRRKLATVSSSSHLISSHMKSKDNMPDYVKSNSKNRFLGENLQICFMNEIQNEDLNENENEPAIEKRATSEPLKSNYLSNLPVFSFKETSTCDDLLVQQLKLQTETREALANVQTIVKLELKNEEVNKKPSPIADIVGLKTYGLERLTRAHIVDMNIGQLQVIANDLFNQIENTNETLKQMLISRDEFYMQQDSYLVDIEDISKRIQEYAAIIKSKAEIKVENPDPKKPYSIDEKKTKSNLSNLEILTNKLSQYTKRTF